MGKNTQPIYEATFRLEATDGWHDTFGLYATNFDSDELSRHEQLSEFLADRFDVNDFSMRSLHNVVEQKIAKQKLREPIAVHESIGFDAGLFRIY